MLNKLKNELKKLANKRKAIILQRFFKTGKGEYGEGDKFLGITVPEQRVLVKKYWKDVSLADLEKLIKSRIHEERLIALLILVQKFVSPPQEMGRGRGEVDKSKIANQKSKILNLKFKIFKLYLSNAKYINNWDLVDLSAPNIVGAYLDNKDRTILYKLAKSQSLWERRIAMLSTFYYIKNGKSKDALRIAEFLLNDKHDLIHKAAGWMLREAGKRCGEKILTDFLDKHSKQMPRTMLRYAIERLPENVKSKYLKKH